jgi:outer membrane murein-binding lipoprotein Lpp
MSDFFQLSLFYTTASANHKLGVIDVNERNRLVYQSLDIARNWCTSAQCFAVYQLFLDKAKSDEMISPLKKNLLEKLASETQIENSDFIQIIREDIRNTAARTSDMERGIKNMCTALGEEFQLLRNNVQKLNSNVQHLKCETDRMGEEVNALRHNVEAVDSNVNKIKKAMLRKMQVESGVAFVSIIANAVSFGAAGPLLQGLANLQIVEALKNIVDFSDLEHVRKVFNTSTIESIESFAISDVIEGGLESAEERANMHFEKAVVTQNSALMITAAATMLAQGYEKVPEDVASPSQGVDFSMPGRDVDHTNDQPEEPPFNANMAREIEIDVEASDAIFSENAHCFDAHELDLENETKVFEASMDRNDIKSKQLDVFEAIHYGHIEDFEHELSVKNVDIKRRDSRNRSCADFAAVMGRLDMIKLILEKGGEFEVYGRAVMMALARKRDAARNKLNKE